MMQTRTKQLLWCMALAGLYGVTCRPVVAEITLHADFESSSLDVEASMVGDGRNAINDEIVFLRGLPTWTEFTRLGPVYFRATGVLGQQPTFNVRMSTTLFNVSQHPYFYSYDQQNWLPFDEGSSARANRRFHNTTPFTQDDVYVSYVIPYPVSRTTDMMSAWTSSLYVTPTTSADENFMLGTVANTRPYGPANLPVYGLKITAESSRLTKKSIVMFGGNHSGESQGNWGLEGAMDFLLSDDSRAVQLRQRAEIIVYPQIDPLGRVEGFYRNNSQNAAIDHNRAWDAETNPTFSDFTEIEMVHAATYADTADFDQIELFFDFHGQQGDGQSSDPNNFVYAQEANQDSAFLAAMQSLVPGFEVLLFEDVESGTDTVYEFDDAHAQGYAPEFRAAGDVEEFLRLGEIYAIAMHAAIVPEPATGVLLMAALIGLAFVRRC
jgi:murein tripeptide amidase MpaA